MYNIFNANKNPDFKNGETIIIDKDKDWSSFDVVNKIKFTLKHQLGLNKLKVGHAGTLDPLATGVVVICTGKATKNISDIQKAEKEYFAIIKIGEITPSFDLETDVSKTYSIEKITEKKIFEAIDSFKGETFQTPPIFSAIWHKGERAYKFAREGKKIDLEKRKIFIKKINVVKISLPFVHLSITCSSGTYIRSLANDIGKRLDNGAFLYYLRRIRCGDFNINDSINIKDFEKIINKM